MKSRRRLSLYHRPGCHLCDEMLDEVEAACRGRSVDIRLVDIDGDPSLKTRYDRDIPVLLADGKEICRHRLDPGRLRAWLSSE